MKGKGFYLLKYTKRVGKSICIGSVKEPERAIIVWLYKVQKTLYFCD